MKAEKGFMYLLLAGEVVLLVVLVIFGVVKQSAGTKEQLEVVVSSQENQTNDLAEESSENIDETEITEEIDSVGVFSEEVEQIISEMTIEEKVAQLFMTTPEVLTKNRKVTIAGEGTRNALNVYPVGGLLYSRANYLGNVQMLELLQGAQNMSQEINGRVLWEGMLVDVAETTVIASVVAGSEETLAELIATEDVTTSLVFEDMEHILYVEEIGAIPQDTTDNLCCYHVTDGVEIAVEALQNGTDMLCVTDGFFEVYEGVLENAKAGVISEDMLYRAVGRILTRKVALSQ